MSLEPCLPRPSKASLFTAVLVVAVLFFGREFLIPVALATLIAFLLRPLVTRLERLKLGRVGSVLVTTLLSFLVIGALGYLVGGQLMELANDLPKYKGHLMEKVTALKVPKDGPLARAKQTLQDLTHEMNSPESAPGPDGEAPAKTVAKNIPSGPQGTERTVKVTQPVPVAVVTMPSESGRSGDDGAFVALRDYVRPLLGPLGMATLVIVFVIFMLLEREDLRDRVVHLCGKGHLQVTTQALDDATRRVSKFLLAQTIVNLSYGVPVGVGLFFLGIPNYFLWGLLATVLRFIPYIGAWISAFFPLVLSLAVSSGWGTPLLTLGLFVVVEIIAGYVVEPWLYGASTGLSSMAVIVAAAFWTWLWGPLGLLLATPLTVCMAVLGKHIPSLGYLDLLLGDHPPIAPEDRFYQRLLAADEDEAITIAESYQASHSLGELYEGLFVPALRLADEDANAGTLSEEARTRMHEVVRDIVADLGAASVAPVAGAPPAPPDAPEVICLAASTMADELLATMLCRLLSAHGVKASVIPARRLASEMMDDAEASTARLFCISVLPSGSTRHGLYVARRLRERLPEARILVGLWGESATDERGRLRRFQQVKVDGVFTSLQDAAREIMATAQVQALPIEPKAD